MSNRVVEDERCARAGVLAAEVARRRAAGESVDDATVIANHPHLRPELDEALDAAYAIHAVVLTARRNAISGNNAFDEPNSDTSTDHDPACRPSIIGYKLIKPIGSGSQAIVYEALQETTGKHVAVKVVAWEPATDSRARSRFEQEVSALASIDHPNIVTVIDRGRTPEGSLYFVMPLIEGPSLDQWLDQRRASSSDYVRDVASIFTTLCRAVNEAHLAGVIHRDLKPANVRVDRFGSPHVLDFGLARRFGANAIASAASRFGATKMGQVVGSLPWSSPEQAKGDLALLDGRSDVYSLGVMLHHALTGQFPYPVTGRVREVIDQIAGLGEDRPTDLPGIESLNASLQAIIRHALARPLDERYPSASAFADDLERYLRGARPLAYDRRRTKAGRRKLLLASFLVIAGIGVTLAIVATGWPDSVDDQRFIPIANPSVTNAIGMTLVLIKPPPPVSQQEFVISVTPRGNHPTDPHGDIRQAYWIGSTEVTVGQYLTIMGTPPSASGITATKPDDSLPVTSVSLEEAEKFCERLSKIDGRRYRLPTEREWEYACRAGDIREPANDDVLIKSAWFLTNSNGQPQPVGQQSPNVWALFDMRGNVAELTYSAKGTGEAIKGGSVVSSATDCRSDVVSLNLDRRYVGFRVVADDASRQQPK